MNFYLEKGVPPLALKMGGTAIEVKSGLNQRNRRLRPFSHYSQVFTRVEGGSEAPTRQLARWGLLLKLHRTS